MLLAASIALSAPAAAVPAPVHTARAATPVVPVMVILDASGSMNQTDAPGSRIDAAKGAVIKLVDGLPSSAQVGLQVYGTGTGSTDAEKTAGCHDIKTLIPVGAVNPAAMKAAVTGVRASGYTPIGNALRAAAAALPAEGPRSIVLVSDGEDTCAPPAPCDVAKDLKKTGIDLVVHTVGFRVDAAARAQLACIAAATGGTYADTRDAGQLDTALQVKVDEAIAGYTLQGTAVNGATTPTVNAPLLNPGQYVDHYALGWASADGKGRPSTTKYYTIPVRNGVRPYVSATVVMPTTRRTEVVSIGANITLLAQNHYTCGTQAGFTVQEPDRDQPTTTVLNGLVVGGPPYSDRCPTDGVLIVKIDRIGTAFGNQSLPLEIVVREEPAADAAGVPPAAGPGPALPGPVLQPAKASPLAGGNSFNDAPAVTSGVTYSGSIVTGENRFYRIPLQWGQRFSYTLVETGPARPLVPGSSAATWVDVFNPVRQAVFMTGPSSGRTWFADKLDFPFTASTPYPVRYTNRNESAAQSYAQVDFELDGYYYLRLSANFFPKGTSSTTYAINIVVSGTVEQGPRYLPAASSAATATGLPDPSSSAVPTQTPSTSPSAGSAGGGTAAGGGRSPGAASSALPAAATGSQQAQPVSSSSSTGSQRWLIIVTALVIVAVAVAVGVVAGRRRGARPPLR